LDTVRFPQRMTRRLVHWSIFAVLASLVPLAADWLRRETANDPASLTSIIGHGQLLLVAGAVAFPAFGALVMSDVHPVTRGVFGGLSLVGLFLVAVLYAQASSPATNIDEHFVVVASIVLFFVMLGVAAICVAVARSEP
jgi:hypothetical protein